jgi:hypothetical protein
MAFLETSGKSEGDNDADFDFDGWLNHNNLSDLKQLFIDHHLTELSTLSPNNPNFSGLLTDQRMVAQMHKLPIIFTAVHNLQKIKKEAVIVSNEENAAMNSLQQYMSEMDECMKANNDCVKLRKQVNDAYDAVIAMVEKQRKATLAKIEESEKLNDYQANKQFFREQFEKCKKIVVELNEKEQERKNKIIQIKTESDEHYKEMKQNQQKQVRAVNINHSFYTDLNKGLQSFIAVVADAAAAADEDEKELLISPPKIINNKQPQLIKLKVVKFRGCYDDDWHPNNLLVDADKKYYASSRNSDFKKKNETMDWLIFRPIDEHKIYKITKISIKGYNGSQCPKTIAVHIGDNKQKWFESEWFTVKESSDEQSFAINIGSNYTAVDGCNYYKLLISQNHGCGRGNWARYVFRSFKIFGIEQ